jgi:hypothetical protein
VSARLLESDELTQILDCLEHGRPIPPRLAAALALFLVGVTKSRSGQAESARHNGATRLERKRRGTDAAIGVLSGPGLPMETRVGIVMGRIEREGQKYGLSPKDLPSPDFIRRRIEFLDSEMHVEQSSARIPAATLAATST